MDEPTRLLRAAASGDRPALAAFVRATQADVWRFCAHLVDPASADDLAQEVYVRALGSAGGFRGEASARTWLLSVARRVAADELRRRQRRRAVAATAPLAADRGSADDTERLALGELVAMLPARRREAFVLTQVLGWSYAEAAEACGVPVGTIRSRVARARGQLLEALDDAEAAGA